MPESGWQPVVIAGLKLNQLLLAVNLKRGRALHNEHPFIGVLFIPEARWAGLTVRDDALNAQAWDFQQIVEGFTVGVGREVCKQVFEHIPLNSKVLGAIHHAKGIQAKITENG